jgi:hypothetical protein
MVHIRRVVHETQAAFGRSYMGVLVVLHSAAERASIVDPTIEKKTGRFPTLIGKDAQ